MKIAQVIGKLSDKVQEILNALSNRLTAEDNFGPEGLKGYILTSNGPRDTDPPPSYQNLADMLVSISAPDPTTGLPGLPGLQGPPGPQGPPGANGMVPTYIAPAEVFTVPAFRQAVWAVPIVVDGVLVVDGALVPVS